MPSGPIFRLPPWSREAVFDTLSPAERDWGLNQFRIPEAWKKGRGAGVKIAVLDTGIRQDHQDLDGQIIDARDFTNSPYGAGDQQGHGTHTAGTIGAKENDVGVVGVCPDIRQKGGGLLIAKVLGDDGSGRGEWIAEGVRWAVGSGAKIISMSLGSAIESTVISESIRHAISSGAYVVAAAGNDGGQGDDVDTVNYPAAMDETIAVAAVTQSGTLARFSSRGPQVDIAAPGQNILSTWHDGGWARLSGTSMATPFVAGCLGLFLSTGLSISSLHDLKLLLKDTATDFGAPGRDRETGWGLINPEKIVERDEEEEIDNGGFHLGPIVIHSPAKPGDLLSIAFSKRD
jgi:subtilisin